MHRGRAAVALDSVRGTLYSVHAHSSLIITHPADGLLEGPTADTVRKAVVPCRTSRPIVQRFRTISEPVSIF